MSSIRPNRAYNNEDIGRGFESIAAMFGPPPASDLAAYASANERNAQAAATKEEAQRLREFAEYAKSQGVDKDTFDRLAVANGRGTIANGYYGVDATAATGDGYKGVHMDAQAKGNVAEWTVSRLAPKQSQAFTISLSQAPANPADLKGTVRWSKPGPKTGPNLDVVNFVLRAPAPPGR